jgi:hypothetical protein
MGWQLHDTAAKGQRNRDKSSLGLDFVSRARADTTVQLPLMQRFVLNTSKASACGNTHISLLPRDSSITSLTLQNTTLTAQIVADFRWEHKNTLRTRKQILRTM